MRAVVVTGPDQLEVTSVPDPVICNPGDAIVRVRRAAICGTDLHVIGQAGERFIPGHEFAGEVTGTGSAVTSVRPGDLVTGADYTACGQCWWCQRGDHWHCPQRQFFGTGTAFGPALDGAQAELVRVPHADVVLRRLPPGFSLDAAVFLGDTLATGYAAVQRAGYRPGDTLAVVGGGPVGQLTSLVAQACGAGAVILIEPVAARREFAAANGALAAEPDSARALADEVTDGRGADAVVDAVGGTLGLDTALYLVRRGGTVVSVGVHSEPTWSLPAMRAFGDELTVRFAIGDFIRDAQPLTALLRTGVVDPTVVMSERVSLDEVPAAYRRMAQRSTLKALVVA
jgi:threonine dehydrogenase-like Zn-dependent dehydrogenase